MTTRKRRPVGSAMPTEMMPVADQQFDTIAEEPAAAPVKKKKRPKKKTNGKKRKKKRKVNHLNLWTIILCFLVFCELITFAAGGIFLTKMNSGKAKLNIDDFFSQESSHIYDRNGNQIADVGTQLRENITYDQMSESLVDAFLSVEDSRFFEHDGFDLPRFTKSVMVNVKNVLTKNSERQGGSTFTMQLVKLTYFQNDEEGTAATKDLEYKVQQISLARELERKTNKKSVFELYLNKMNFGGTGNIRGIEKAAQYYYGKSAGELNTAEAAMLAGVINSPYWFDPHNYLDYATERRNTVLYLMNYHGYITDTEYQLATAIKVEDTLVDPTETRGGLTYEYQSYIDYVIEETERLTGQDPFSVAMDIYTYMDPAAQTMMDNIQSGNNPNVEFSDDLIECGMIAENNQTGEIVAIGGGRNYGRGGSMLLNHATGQYKQPGSTVKPILDYALAFEYLGWATSHVVTDRPILYAGTDMIIKNASGRYGGEMTLRNAISFSLNTPAIQALQDVIEEAGWLTVVNYLKSLGFSQVSEDNFDIGFAIGGSNFTCTPLELMAAHAIIMNGGNYIKPHTIQKIVFRNGTQEPIEPRYDAVQVLSPQAAYMVSVMMNYVTQDYIYAEPLRRDYPTYVKTGTTDWGTEGLQYNIPAGVSKDVWMVSETSQYTTAVWVGYEKGIKDKDTWLDDYKLNMNMQGKISAEILSVLNDDIRPEGVQRPDGLSDITHILGVFPYVYPVADMDQKYVTTGIVKSEFSTLKEAENTDEIEEIKEFTADFTDNGINLRWGTYPNEEKMKGPGEQVDISLYAGETLLVEAWGNKLFDYSWIFGQLRYKATIKQNGNVVGEVVSETPEFRKDDLDLKADTETEACGYYGYENGEGKSNEICVTFRTPEEEEDDDDNDNHNNNNNSNNNNNKTDDKKDNSTPTPEVTMVAVPAMDADVDSVRNWCILNSVEVTENIDRNTVMNDPSPSYTNVIFKTDGTMVNNQEVPAGEKLRCYILIPYEEPEPEQEE